MRLAETKRKEENQIVHKPSHCEVPLDESDSDNDSSMLWKVPFIVAL